MIDEKKLIEDIKDRLFINNALEQIFIEIVEQQPKTDWIPCEERLPDKRGNYLVCSKGVTWVANWFLNTWWGIEKRCRYSDVEAWQPLPQPYKKEGERNVES